MQHEKYSTEKTWKVTEIATNKKSAIWKECNIERVQHEKRATREMRNMEIVQYKQSIVVTEWKNEKSENEECSRVHIWITSRPLMDSYALV